jgi:protein-tyrosine-phosphatase
MKILFVCRGNVGRSQMGEALLRKMRPDLEIRSVGTIVKDPDGVSKDGQVMKDCPGAAKVIEVMKEVGVDVSNETRTQLYEPMLEWPDRIIVMAEPENIPTWLSSSPKYIYWDVTDPKDTPTEFHRNIRDRIQKNLEDNASLFEE